jgi:hypothetical protein
LATTEYNEFITVCIKHLMDIQNRVVPPQLPVSPEELRERVRIALLKASRAELLRTGAYSIPHLLRPVSCSRRTGERDTYEFSCGPIRDELKRPDSSKCLVRDDDAVLSFSITLGTRKEINSLELIAYRFDLTFPPEVGIGFIRFDLDQPDKGHSRDGLRAHIHPGLSEGRVPSPILDPVEAIHLLLVHLRKGKTW